MKLLLGFALLPVIAGVGPESCGFLFYVTTNLPDPPTRTHRAGDAGGGPGEAAAGGRAFKGRAVGQLTGKLTLTHGKVRTKTNKARFVGTYKSTLTGTPQAGDESLGPLAAADWHGRFSAVRSRATGKITAKGLVLATFTEQTAGRACLSLSYRANRKQNRRKLKRARSTLTVLGGEGDARTLRGVATVRRITFKSDGSIRMSGRVKARRGAERGMPKQCRKLARKFGLQPL